MEIYEDGLTANFRQDVINGRISTDTLSKLIGENKLTNNQLQIITEAGVMPNTASAPQVQPQQQPVQQTNTNPPANQPQVQPQRSTLVNRLVSVQKKYNAQPKNQYLNQGLQGISQWLDWLESKVGK